MSTEPVSPEQGGEPLVPGEVLVGAGEVVLRDGVPRVVVEVVNTGDRPVQVGSHVHLSSANAALSFDRALAWGHRLDVAAGNAVRFEPGVERTVTLVPFGGDRQVPGQSLPPPGALDDGPPHDGPPDDGQHA